MEQFITMNSLNIIDEPRHYSYSNSIANFLKIPAGRFGAPEEIVRAAVYFASNESRFLLGTELIIDGGMATL